MLHIVCCAKLLLDPNSKISCLNVASFLGRKAFENLDCYPKSTTKIIKKHFWKLRQGRTMSLICLKAKNEVNLKKNYFDLVQIKISFAHFWKIKMNIKQILFANFLFVDCSLMYQEGVYKFSKKYWFLRSLWFFENENFAAHATRSRAAEIADFLELSS